MNSYFSTFFTGFDKVIEQVLVKRLKDVKIDLLADGLVIYKTTSTPDEIKQVKFLNNSFVLLKKVDKLSHNPIKDMLKIPLKKRGIDSSIKNVFPKENLKFRIRASFKNQFVAVDKNLLKNIEEKITRVANNLRVDRSLPDIEFLIAIRSEGFGLIGIQFTHRTNYEKALEKGEIYPELAHILCLISEPKKEDVFLDPFAGYGSIPIQRAISFPYKKIIASDVDQILVGKLRKKISRIHKKIIVKNIDALNLKSFEANSVDKVVTDPPWGLYKGTDLNLPTFYFQMLEEFCRVIRVNGYMVILTAQKELLEAQLNKLKSKLKVVSKYNTLISGKKAGVYKIKRV